MHPSLSPLLHSSPGRLSLLPCWNILWAGSSFLHGTACTELKELQSTKEPAGTNPSWDWETPAAPSHLWPSAQASISSFPR